MPTRNDELPDDLLVRYLLGTLPEDETERLDESSVTDDEVALRLGAAENDLVDSWVRGELDGPTRRRFETHYLASKARREKVALAAALLDRERAGSPPAFHAVPPVPAERRTGRPHRTRAGRIPRWQLAAAAALILLTSGSLLVLTLRSNVPVSETSSTGTMARPDLQARTETPRATTPASPPTEKPAAPTAPAEAAPSLTSISFLLAPQTRAAAGIATLSVPPSAREVTARLQLEFDDFERYEATLTDPSTDRIVWRSVPLRAQSEGRRRTVAVRIPAALLSETNYSVELAGIAPGAASEFVGSYVFRVVLE